MRAIACGVLVALLGGCGGSGQSTAAVAAQGGGSGSGSAGSGAALATTDSAGGAAGGDESGGQPGAGGAAAGDSGGASAGVAGSAQAVAGGGSGGEVGGTAGSGGSAATDPDCAASNTHALPAKCAAPAPVNCSLMISKNPNSCTGDGACPNDAGKICAPMGLDYSLCRDGRIGTCDAGTCGTAAGAKCALYQNDVVYPPEFCPCFVLGTIVSGS